MSKSYNKYSPTTYLILCGLFAALTAICSFITIPLGFTPVPINLGTFGVFLTGGLLGKKYGCISILVYILLGIAGIPVFSGFRAGLSVLAGPTGGYIAGYLLAVFIIGLLTDKMSSDSKRKSAAIIKYALCMTLGLVACYTAGTLWFMYSCHVPFTAAFISCVLPFIAGDITKITAAVILVTRLKKLL